MEAFKTWEEMSTLEQYACQYWDMHKDAYGVRPRCIDTSSWTEAEFKAEFEYLIGVIKDNEQARRAAEEQAAHAFEMRVQSILACGAKDRAMALRWIHEAEDTGGDNEYLCYTLGLPYRYFLVDKQAV